MPRPYNVNKELSNNHNNLKFVLVIAPFPVSPEGGKAFGIRLSL